MTLATGLAPTQDGKIAIDPEFRSLIPPLQAEELSQLEANLKRDGCRDPLVVWEECGILLDGHHRLEICQRERLEFSTVALSFADRDAARLWVVMNQLGRRNLAPYQRCKLALVAKPILSAQAKARQQEGGMEKLLQISGEAVPIRTDKKLATMASVSHDTIHKAEVLSERATPEVEAKVLRGDVTINKAYMDVVQADRRAARVARVLAHGRAPDLTTLQPVPVLYADPPWRYEASPTASRAIENHYDTMTLADICALPVSAAATDDAVLFLWAPSPKLAEAQQVITAWGFTHRTSAVWVKDKIGMGFFYRQRHEFLLVATRGTLPAPEPATRPDSVLTAPRLRHSQKPTAVYEHIEAMYPEYAKRELFARGAPRAGWFGWGHECLPTQEVS